MKAYISFSFACPTCGRHLLLMWPEKMLIHPDDPVGHCVNAGKRFKLPYYELEEIHQ